MLCGGECCHYVNRVVDALLENGDIRPDVVFVDFLIVVSLFIYVPGSKAWCHGFNSPY